MGDRLAAHGVAVTGEHHALGFDRAGHVPGEPDGADRFLLAAAVGPGDAGHGQGHVGGRMRQRARSHLPRHGLADRAGELQHLGVDPERVVLGRVAVTDETALEPGRTAGLVGAALGDPAAGAGLGRGQPPSLFQQSGGQGPDPFFQ